MLTKLHDPCASQYSFLVASGVIKVHYVPGAILVDVPRDAINRSYPFEENIPHLCRVNDRQPQRSLKNPCLVSAAWMLVA